MPSSAPIRPVSLAPESIHADVWHAHALAGTPAQVLATGDAALDAQLPGGGWPVGALTEVLQPDGVHSEWRLLLPALAGSGTGPVVLVGAPQVPFAPALAAQGLRTERLLWVNASNVAARLWAAEQALRCAEVDAVLLWLAHAGAQHWDRSERVRTDQLRRLQMAAFEHHKLLFVMRPETAQHEASPAALRLRISPQQGQGSATPDDALQVQLLKRRGPPLEQPLHLHARPARLSVLLAASRLQKPQPSAWGGSERGSGDALDRTATAA